MSTYSVEVVVRRLDDRGHFIEDTLMDETVAFEAGNQRAVWLAAASEAAMLVADALMPANV